MGPVGFEPTTCGLKGTSSGRQIVMFTSGNLQAKRRLRRRPLPNAPINYSCIENGGYSSVVSMNAYIERRVP